MVTCVSWKLRFTLTANTDLMTFFSLCVWVPGGESCLVSELILLETRLDVLLVTHISLGLQASRESLTSSASGDVSEASLPSNQGALGAPVMPQPSGLPAAAPAAAPAAPSKVAHTRKNTAGEPLHIIFISLSHATHLILFHRSERSSSTSCSSF